MLKVTSDYPPPPGTLKPTSTYRGYTELGGGGGITKLGHGSFETAHNTIHDLISRKACKKL